MSSSQRSEGINHFFDGFINSKTTLTEFIGKYEDALEKRYEAENEEDNRTLQTIAFLKTSSPFERQAAGRYTRHIFKKFQNEILEMAASKTKLIKEAGNCCVYSVKSYERIEVDGIGKEMIKDYIVSYDRNIEDVQCQCRSFQFKGYLCRHALLVLHQSDVFRLPDKYFLKRWCKDMKYQFDDFSCNTEGCDKSTRKSRYSLLSHRMMKLAEIASMSEDAFNLVMDGLTPIFKIVVDANCTAKPSTELVIQDPEKIRPKGRPRENRLKSGVEKKSKRSRKNLVKATVDAPPMQNEIRAASSNRQTCMQSINTGEDMERIVTPSKSLMDEFDDYVLSQLTQEHI